ncbi:MAG: hypothetical protein ACK4PI_02810 [Tepidisphaerales bacterium]
MAVLLPARVAGQVSGAGGGGGLGAAGLSGDVERVGFDQTFRPAAWTPLVVRLRAEAGRGGTYQLRVEQDDLDRDVVAFVRTVSLTGGAGEQRFLTYFQPQGVRTMWGLGLPDRTQNSRLDQLQGALRVWLCDEQGRKLMRLPVRSMVGSVEGSGAVRGTRLVLFVRGPESVVMRGELAEPASVVGLTEDVAIVEVTPAALPASSAGYAGVDAVVWGAGPPPDRAVAGEAARWRALREYVVGGGRLVVLQAAVWQLTAAWGDWLPVRFDAAGGEPVRRRPELDVLRRLAGDPAVGGDGAVPGGGVLGGVVASQAWTGWAALTGPHVYGVTTALPGAVVEAWWTDEAGKRSPWLARHGVGSGVVSYVAQDLASPLLSGRAGADAEAAAGGEGVSGANRGPPGWSQVWMKVLDYREWPVATAGGPTEVTRMYAPARTVFDLGAAVVRQMELTSRAGALVGVAAVFFVVYGLLAGPGLWWVLRRRGLGSWQWPCFAAVALGATLLTLVVVQVSRMGGPELRHLTVVRAATGEVARLETRVGLFVPEDGEVRVAWPAGSPNHFAAVTGYAIHPEHASASEEFLSPGRYVVEVRDVAGAEEVGVSVPFRSTLKRLEGVWHGEWEGRLVGTVAVAPPGNTLLTGPLINGTGQTLRNVYLVYRTQRPPNAGQDVWVYVPEWSAGEQWRMEELTDLRRMPRWGVDGEQPERWSAQALAGGGRISGWGLMGTPGREFEVERWLRGDLLARQLVTRRADFDDSAREVPRVWPLLSLFDRVPVMRNVAATVETRSELLRLNARFLDVSSAVSAGRLVVLAEARGVPMPVPLKVDGRPVGGVGTVLYQFVLPLDRARELEGLDDGAEPGGGTPGQDGDGG